MRPGDTITGTNGTALVTAMQFRINLRQDRSELELPVVAKTPNGRKHMREWTRSSAQVSPTLNQIGNAMTAIEATAQTDIEAMLSR